MQTILQLKCKGTFPTALPVMANIIPTGQKGLQQLILKSFKARRTDTPGIQLQGHTFPNRFPCTCLQQGIRRNKSEIPMQFQGKWSMKESS